jgi:hypothetical protein
MHIHVKGVELNIFTTHRKSGFAFRSVFSKKYNAKQVQAAIKHVKEKCLPKRAIRRRWISRLEMARIFMLNYEGEHASLANGKMYDFKLIRIALERWGEKYGDS